MMLVKPESSVVVPSCLMSLAMKRLWMLSRPVGRQLWSMPNTVAVRSRKGRSTRVSMPRN